MNFDPQTLERPDPASVLRIHGPSQSQVPIVLDSPHSGIRRPPDFTCLLADDDLRDATDLYIDQLYLPATELGISLLAAQYQRTYIDANRHEGDVDLELLDGPWPGIYLPSGKAQLGKALTWRTLDDGRPLYSTPMSVRALQWRIENYHRPYHLALKRLIDTAHTKFGVVYHINCHSMNPVSGLMGEGCLGSILTDFVLGDRDGSTCSSEFTSFVHEKLSAYGYSVAINQPFKGVELVRAYANPVNGRHSLQLEINKRLYMDEIKGQPTAQFSVLQQQLMQLLKELIDNFKPVKNL